MISSVNYLCLIFSNLNHSKLNSKNFFVQSKTFFCLFSVLLCVFSTIIGNLSPNSRSTINTKYSINHLFLPTLSIYFLKHYTILND